MLISQNINIFSSIAAAVFLEAMPFLAFGALIGAIIEVYVSPERLTRYIPRNFVAGIAIGVGAGFIIPTCECGVVPIVRRMMGKGVAPHVAIPYMLAAPIINPIVMASTYIAFRGNLIMVIGRVVIAAVVAAAFGVILRKADSASLLLASNNNIDHHVHHDCHQDHNDHSSPGPLDVISNGCACDCGHVHGHAHDGARRKFMEVLTHAGHDFLDMGKYLILGALAAAFFKTFLPQEIVEYFNANIIMAVCGMMALAVVLSICSEADAFVAASFVSFPDAAQLAFISIGPMVDLKLIGMFAASFHSRFFQALMLLPILFVFGLSLMFSALFHVF